MICRVKEINETTVTVEFKDGSSMSVPFSALPNPITLDDFVIINNFNSTPNEKYIDYF